MIKMELIQETMEPNLEKPPVVHRAKMIYVHDKEPSVEGAFILTVLIQQQYWEHFLLELGHLCNPKIIRSEY